MKTYLWVILLLLLPLGESNQRDNYWCHNKLNSQIFGIKHGGQLRYNRNESRDVGIGIANPRARLDVNGEVVVPRLTLTSDTALRLLADSQLFCVGKMC